MTEEPPETDPRGALGDAFVQALWANWKANGADAIEKVRKDKPDLYVKLVTAMLPKELGLKTSEPDDLDDAALDRRIASLAAALGLAIGSGEGAAGQGRAPRKKPARRIPSVHEAD